MDAVQAAHATAPTALDLARAVEVIEAATELGFAVERAIAARAFSQINVFLDRRQALLEELMALTRAGVTLDHEAVRPRWQRLLMQDRVTQDNLMRAMRKTQKKLSSVRRSLNTTAAYGERPPQARASVVDLRG